ERDHLLVPLDEEDAQEVGPDLRDVVVDAGHGPVAGAERVEASLELLGRLEVVPAPGAPPDPGVDARALGETRHHGVAPDLPGLLRVAGERSRRMQDGCEDESQERWQDAAARGRHDVPPLKRRPADRLLSARPGTQEYVLPEPLDQLENLRAARRDV